MKRAVLVGCALVLLTACKPEMGSKAWCEALDEKPKGEWSFNESADYARHCLLRGDEAQ